MKCVCVCVCTCGGGGGGELIIRNFQLAVIIDLTILAMSPTHLTDIHSTKGRPHVPSGFLRGSGTKPRGRARDRVWASLQLLFGSWHWARSGGNKRLHQS